MKHFKPIAVAAMALVILAGCGSEPGTSRNQLIHVDDRQMHALGAKAYEEMKQKMPRSEDRALDRRVREIGERIAAISPEPDWDWEFTLFEKDDPNAFTLPGGKIGINTGLLDTVKNDDQLAAVIGHQIARAVARHGVETVSRAQLARVRDEVTGTVTGRPSASGNDAALAELRREQTSEADRLGLLYMAEAGYDPRAAVDLWRNMEAAGAGGPLEFPSTHPSPGNRIERLQQLMPEALEVYRSR